MAVYRDDLTRVDVWAEANRHLVLAAWESFTKKRLWPSLEDLQRQCERQGVDIDVGSLAFNMPNGLGFVEQERLVLRVRALRYLPEATETLDAWARSLVFAYRQYIEHDDAILRAKDLRDEVGLGVQQASLVSHLLLREGWAFGSGTGGPDDPDWQREIRSGVRIARDVTNAASLLAARDAIDYGSAYPGIETETTTLHSHPQATSTADPSQTRRVMVVYGRDTEVNRALFHWLRAVDLRPMEWTELVMSTGSGSPYTGDVLDRAMEIVQAVVVLFTPDDLVRLRSELLAEHDDPAELEVQAQPRPNVLFEAGLAFGRHPTRTVLVEYGQLRGFSDLFGRHAVRLERGTAALQDLAARLQATGCAVNRDGSDWLDASILPSAPSVVSASLSNPDVAPAPSGASSPPHRVTPSEREDQLARLVGEILAAALGQPVAEDVVHGISTRIRDLRGSTRGDELFDGLPGRQLPVEAIKRTMYELEQHGVLRRNPDERVRGYILGDVPS